MKKILAIDDQLDNLTTLKAVLKSQIPDCMVLTALSGTKGIEIAQKEQPDAILLDIIMPQMDGYEVCSRLKADDLTKHIPIIMLTAIKTDSGSRVKGLTLGADAFLAKPIDQTELIAQVRVMFRIKDAEDKLRGDKYDLEKLVAERTEKLRESEEKYKTLYENAPLPFQSLNEDGSFKDINPAWLKTLGYERSDVIGKFYIDFLKPDWKEHFETNFHAFKKRGYVNDVQFKIRHKNGHYLDISFEGSIGYHPDGSFKQAYCVFQDITERKLAESALQESEEKFRKAFITSPDSININRLDDGTYITINHGFTQIMGYSEEEVIGKTSLELKIWKNPNDRSKLIESLKSKGIVENMEAEFCAKNGETKYGLMSANIIELDGKPHILSITRDITIRKKAEKALFESEHRFSKLIQQSPFIIEIYDANGVQISVNKAYENLWGFSASQTVNKFNILKSKEVEKSGLLKYVNQAYKGKAVSVPEYQFDPTGDHKERGKGRIHWLSTKIFPLNDPAGNIVNIAIMHEDVTERKRSEQIQKVLYNISDTVTSSKNTEELIAIIKDHLSTIIDTTNYYIGFYDEQTKMISLPFVADEKDEIESFHAEYSLTGHVIRTQKSLLVTADQQEEMVKKGIIKFVGSRSQVWLGVPLTINGVVKGALAVQSYTDKNAYSASDREILEFVSDQISLSIERKQKEQELIKALEKATESDQLKSSFLATMSHELRTPLNAIIGFSDIISEDLPIAEIMEFNQTINSSGNHLLTIVEDLFDITLIETGEIKIIKDIVNLNLLLHEVNEIIKIEQSNLKKEQLELNLFIPNKEMNLMIKTDPWRIKQILINLLKNALKFTHKGSVSYGFEIIRQDGMSLLQFFVKDTGIGIPKDKQELIFDIFRQIEDSHTRSYGGTGIGLSISRRLTELLGGHMWVDSDKNGSSFYFTIPLEMAGNLNEHQIIAGSVIASNENITILVVEDDTSSFEFLKIILKNTAQFILWAQNGEEAVKLCKNDPDIDLVLMDLNMPVMNGYDATKAIKSFRPTLPIIAQTAYAIAGDREKSLAVGCDEYISKPIKREELLDKVSKFIWRKSAI